MGALSLDDSELLGQTVMGLYEIILGCSLHYNLKKLQTAIKKELSFHYPSKAGPINLCYVMWL